MIVTEFAGIRWHQVYIFAIDAIMLKTIWNIAYMTWPTTSIALETNPAIAFSESVAFVISVECLVV
jgi:hypothetical protein